MIGFLEFGIVWKILISKLRVVLIIVLINVINSVKLVLCKNMLLY